MQISLKRAAGILRVSYERVQPREAGERAARTRAGVRPDAGDANQQRLAQLVLRSRFRPRVTNFQFSDSELIVGSLLRWRIAMRCDAKAGAGGY
jgi:hypothetical protein